jgi:hypothetical protein
MIPCNLANANQCEFDIFQGAGSNNFNNTSFLPLKLFHIMKHILIVVTNRHRLATSCAAYLKLRWDWLRGRRGRGVGTILHSVGQHTLQFCQNQHLGNSALTEMSLLLSSQNTADHSSTPCQAAGFAFHGKGSVHWPYGCPRFNSHFQIQPTICPIKTFKRCSSTA